MANVNFDAMHLPSIWNIRTDRMPRIFLFVGLITIASVPFVYWKLDSSIPTARFLTPHERLQAVERLRANQTGIGSSVFDWSHIYEILYEPKTHLWISMSLLVNVGASVTVSILYNLFPNEKKS